MEVGKRRTRHHRVGQRVGTQQRVLLADPVFHIRHDLGIAEQAAAVSDHESCLRAGSERRTEPHHGRVYLHGLFVRKLHDRLAEFERGAVGRGHSVHIEKPVKQQRDFAPGIAGPVFYGDACFGFEPFFLWEDTKTQVMVRDPRRGVGRLWQSSYRKKYPQGEKYKEEISTGYATF